MPAIYPAQSHRGRGPLLHQPFPYSARFGASHLAASSTRMPLRAA